MSKNDKRITVDVDDLLVVLSLANAASDKATNIAGYAFFNVYDSIAKSGYDDRELYQLLKDTAQRAMREDK